RERVERTERKAPGLRFLSNVTGDWIGAEEATSADYWCRHLRGCVRFAPGVNRLLQDGGGPILLEVGPGNTLSSLARQQMPAGSGSAALASMRHPREQEDDRAHVLKALGGLWLSGGRIDWARLHAGQPRQRVPL